MKRYMQIDPGPTFCVWYLNEFFSKYGYLVEIVHEEGTRLAHQELPMNWMVA